MFRRVPFLTFSDDDSAHDGQSQETWAGGSSSSELRGSQLVTVHAPSKRPPPTNNQHLPSPPGLPHLWTKPWVQRNHSLTTHTRPSQGLPPKPPRAFQAAGVAAQRCDALQQMSVESLVTPPAERHDLSVQRVSATQASPQWSVSPSALWARANHQQKQ